MRTTLDLDDQLLARVQAQFPPGTPKTVLVEEGLRRLLAGPVEAVPRARDRDPRIERLIAEGHVVAAMPGAWRPAPAATPSIPAAQLLADLARDREDR